MEHGVLGSDVAPGFGAALGVDGAADVAEVAQQVEGVEHHREARLGKVTREAGVPHQLVGVHGVIGVAAARVHRHVGGELECCGQLHERSEAVVEIIEGERLEVMAAGRGVSYADVALGADGVFAELIVELHSLSSPPCVDTAAHGSDGRIFANEIYAVVEFCMGDTIERKSFALVKRATIVYVSCEQIVAVYVPRFIIAFASSAVVCISVSDSIYRDVIRQTGREICLFLGVISLIQESHKMSASVFESAIEI